MKKLWKWLGILFFGFAALGGAWLLGQSWRLQTADMLRVVAVVIVCAFVSLTMLLGKRNQLVVSAFIINSFHIWFYIHSVVEYVPNVGEVLVGIEVCLVIYILVLLLGEKYLDWMIDFAKIREEDEAFEEVEEVKACINLDKWIAYAKIFFAGAVAMLLALEVVQLLAGMRVYHYVYVLLGALAFCHVAVCLWRNPKNGE